MFDHVGISVSDRAASRRFYDTVLAPLGHRLTHQTEHFDEWDDFGTAQADAERPVTTGLHVAFVAGSRDDVDAFWHAGIDAGYPSDGEPARGPSTTRRTTARFSSIPIDTYRRRFTRLN